MTVKRAGESPTIIQNSFYIRHPTYETISGKDQFFMSEIDTKCQFAQNFIAFIIAFLFIIDRRGKFNGYSYTKIETSVFLLPASFAMLFLCGCRWCKRLCTRRKTEIDNGELEIKSLKAQRRIQNPVKHLRWSLLRKQLTG